jgi:type II secretory pathway pseudopilin PulG
MRGFTLVEALVVISIILVITLVFVPNLRLAERSQLLGQAAQILDQDLRRAEEMGLSAKEFHGIIPRGGYGLYFPGAGYTSYIIFADCSDPPTYRYNTSATVCNGFPEKVEEVVLPNGIQLTALSPSSPLQITFTSPMPKITFSNATGEVTGLDATIALLLTATGQQRVVDVNKAGLVEIQ